ncbi:MAG: pyrroline-5-carboxylate reductase, partial [Firmicutes bacterium]|nr:pyrroline-5-carboxylate reductase [Bacillota bacterium]
AKAETLAKELGAKAAGNAEIAEKAYYIFLGVKPQMIEELRDEIRPVLEKRTSPFVLVSMLAGVKAERIKSLSGRDAAVIRIMPNTPCSIGEGVVLINTDCGVSSEDAKEFEESMKAAGGFVELPEELFDAGCAVSGCGPAFVDIFMDALAKGGAACGLNEAQALKLAALTAAGSAKLLLASGKSPEELKQAVCSPGGATIEGVKILEGSDFTDTVIKAVNAACERSKQLGR